MRDAKLDAEHRLRRKHHRPPRRQRSRRCKPLLFGSHIDSVPGGGNYDGDVGSLVGDRGRADARRQLDRDAPSARGRDLAERGRRSHRQPRRERPARRRPNSRPSRTAARRSRTGIALHRRRSVEAGSGEADEGRRSPAISSCTSSRAARSSGESRHRRRRRHRRHQAVGSDRHRFPEPRRHDGDGPSGTTRCSRRRASSTWSIASCASMPGRQVGTVGRIQAFPGAPNVIPGQSRLHARAARPRRRQDRRAVRAHPQGEPRRSAR